MIKRMMTTHNVGWFDRLLRLVPAIAVGVLWAQGLIGGSLAMVLAILAAMLAVTAMTGACSIYYALGLSTLRTKPPASEPR